MGSLEITLAREVKDAKDKGQGKPLHKAGESLTFSMDDQELTSWVNDLTNVWRPCRQGADCL